MTSTQLDALVAALFLMPVLLPVGAALLVELFKELAA